MEIDGARALIAGSAGGFGIELTRALRSAGASVVISGRRPSPLAALSAELGCRAIAADLTAGNSVVGLVAEAAAHLGGLDLVICAVGVVAFGPVSELDDDTLRELFEVNTLLPIRLARAALGVLDRGGVIINTTGIVAQKPMAGMAAYSASKAALSAFDVAFAREARRVGVHVMDLSPPHMETGLANRPLAGTPPNLPTGRDPAEMAQRVVDALANDAAEVDWS